MTRAEYQRVLGAAHAARVSARSFLASGLLDEAIAAIGTADAAGAVLDPTLYRERRAAMAQDEATLRLFRMLGQLGTQNLVGEGARGTQASSPAEQLATGGAS